MVVPRYATTNIRGLATARHLGLTTVVIADTPLLPFSEPVDVTLQARRVRREGRTTPSMASVRDVRKPYSAAGPTPRFSSSPRCVRARNILSGRGRGPDKVT